MIRPSDWAERVEQRRKEETKRRLANHPRFCSSWTPYTRPYVQHSNALLEAQIRKQVEIDLAKDGWVLP